MIVDLFPFNDELDLLELRLAELDPVVDLFVAIESPRTYTQNDKPLRLTEALAEGRYRRWRSKLKVVIPAAVPEGPHPILEHFQRQELYKHIPKEATVCMLSDADEIPDRRAIIDYAKEPAQYPMTFTQKLYYYSVTHQVQYPWHGTVMFRREHIEHHDNPDLEKLRQTRAKFPEVAGGWHFSWLGDAKQIKEKFWALDVQRDIEFYGSKHMNIPENDEILRMRRSRGEDLFGRDFLKIRRVAVLPGENQPFEIDEWLRKFPEYVS